MGAVMERQVHGRMMLVTRPNYDPATRYLHQWSEILIEEAGRRNINVVDLEGKKAATESVGRPFEENPPVFSAFERPRQQTGCYWTGW